MLGIYCIICWKLDMTKAPKEEKICVVISKTYEIIEDESAHRRSSHDEGIEVEYHDADGAHVLGPTSPTGSPTGSTPRADLEAGTPLPPPPPRPPRSRFDTADTFPENESQPGGFHVGLLDRIVTFFNTGNGGRRGRRRQSSQQSLSASSSAANVLQQADLSLGELKKEGDTTALPATRERTRTETTVQSSELESSTFEENSVSGHISPRGRVDADVSGETGETSDSAASQPLGTGLTGLPSLDEE